VYRVGSVAATGIIANERHLVGASSRGALGRAQGRPPHPGKYALPRGLPMGFAEGFTPPPKTPPPARSMADLPPSAPANANGNGQCFTGSVRPEEGGLAQPQSMLPVYTQRKCPFSCLAARVCSTPGGDDRAAVTAHGVQCANLTVQARSFQPTHRQLCSISNACGAGHHAN
jgi:hypothetical protein